MADYDVIVIGAGPGGYVCAIRCAQLGLKVACVEGRETLGGTCLNIGCIPSKAMLHASELYHTAHTHFAEMGLTGPAPGVDLPQMLKYKQSTVDQNTRGIEFLFKKNKVTWLKGWASIPAPGVVSIGDETHTAKAIVLAPGSEPASLAGVDVDEKTIVTSTGALELAEVPKRLVVIGAGVIGLEMGSVYARLGAQVTVVEFLDQITPGMDLEICKTLQKVLTKQGLKFILGAAVQGAAAGGDGIRVTWRLRKDDSEHAIDADTVLVCHRPQALHRRPRPRRAGRGPLPARPDRGRCPLADQRARHLRPRRRHRRPDARPQGRGRGHGGRRDHRGPAWPRELRRDPERDLHEPRGRRRRRHRGGAEGGRPRLQGRQVPLHGQRPRQVALRAADGFVKLLADTETDRLLGAHIIGPAAGELIAEICVAMEFGAAAEDVARTCHAHPTFSEAVREAALACGDGAIHA